MVHGDYYGINYIIYLTKPIDLFNDLLPICISNRHMLTLITPTKINIFNSHIFDKRLNAKEMSSLFYSFSELQYQNKQCRNLLKNRQLFPNLYLYYDVFIYSTLIKGIPINAILNDELDVMKTRYNELENMLNNDTYDINNKSFFEELKLLHKTIEIQTIICDKEYLQKIINIEGKITNNILTDEETMLIRSIEFHPTINKIIEKSGFEIIKEYY